MSEEKYPEGGIDLSRLTEYQRSVLFLGDPGMDEREWNKIQRRALWGRILGCMSSLKGEIEDASSEIRDLLVDMEKHI